MLIENSRDVYITSQSFGVYSSKGDEDDSDDEGASNEEISARPLKFLPQTDCSTSLWYKGHWMRATRSVREGQWGGRLELLDIWQVFPFFLSFLLSLTDMH